MPDAFASPTPGFPLAVFLIPYGLFLLIYLFYTVFNLYHFIRYGFKGVGLDIILAVYVTGSFVLLGGSMLVLAQYDWGMQVTTGNFFGTINEILFPATL